MVHLMADGQFSYVQYSQAHLATSSVIVAPPLREASCRSEGLSARQIHSQGDHTASNALCLAVFTLLGPPGCSQNKRSFPSSRSEIPNSGCSSHLDDTRRILTSLGRRFIWQRKVHTYRGTRIPPPVPSPPAVAFCLPQIIFVVFAYFQALMAA